MPQAKLLGRKADRHAFVDALISAALKVPGAILVSHYTWASRPGARDEEITLNLGIPQVLGATLSIRAGRVPIISWYGAKAPLREVPGAWYADDINRFHRLKATSFPPTLSATVDKLVAGLTAAADGSAFRKD